MALVEVSNLSKVFSRDGKTVEAISDLSLTFEKGEFISIVGPSGCGKTTFLHVLGGFEPKTAGSVRLDSREIIGPGTDRGVMFQEYSLYPWRSVKGNVGWPLEIQGVPKPERDKIVEHFLRLVGLQQFRDHYPAELSGGMKQRVALARVLAFDPQILLMDEPFGALDAQTRELMQEEVQAIWLETRKTVLFITHDIDEAIYLSDRVVVFTARPGQIKDEVAIEFDRPRSLEIRKTARYMDYRNVVWDLLREEVLKARAEAQ